jgi:hypothetical protein
MVRARRLASAVASILIALAIAATAVLARQGLLGPRPLTIGAAPPASPAAAMAAAAVLLEATTAKGGAGYTFEIVQRSTMHAKPGGPKIEIPDPVDPHKSLGFADAYEMGALIERGAATPDGFTMEMRTGPAPGAEPDWKAPYQFGVTTQAGKVFRNDGDGWYATDAPPGIGLDPTTVQRLPALLRNATGLANAGFSPVRGVSLPTITGNGKIADVPGIVAVDGAPFTALESPLEFTVDDQGRLVLLHVIARNTNLEQFDLMVDTLITFDYAASAAPLPEPSPARPADVQR